jgi:hypothetical protein
MLIFLQLSVGGIMFGILERSLGIVSTGWRIEFKKRDEEK